MQRAWSCRRRGEVQTAIPTFRFVEDWRFDQVVSISQNASGAFEPELEGLSTSFMVVYKDPHVLAVPEALGGGYLMLLAAAAEVVQYFAIDRTPIMEDFVTNALGIGAGFIAWQLCRGPLARAIRGRFRRT